MNPEQVYQLGVAITQHLFYNWKGHAKRKKVLTRHLNLIQMEVKWLSLQKKDYDSSYSTVSM